MLNDFLKKQDKQLEAKQLQAYRRILKTVNATKAEIISEIESVSEFNHFLLSQTLINIDEIISDLRYNLGNDFDRVMRESSETGVNHQIDLIEEISGYSISKAIETSLFGGAELKVLEVLEMNSDEYLNRFTAQIREKVKNTIQQSFIHGEGQGTTIVKIREQFKTDLNSTHRAVHHIYQSGYNAANHEVLIILKESVPNLMKQWWSQMDRVTTKVCMGLHEQTQEVEDSFVDPHSGSFFMFPPAVWGNPDLEPIFHLCRSRAIPFFKS